MQTFQCCLSAWPGELTATLPKRVFLFSFCVCRWPSLGFPAWKPISRPLPLPAAIAVFTLLCRKYIPRCITTATRRRASHGGAAPPSHRRTLQISQSVVTSYTSVRLLSHQLSTTCPRKTNEGISRDRSGGRCRQGERARMLCWPIDRYVLCAFSGVSSGKSPTLCLDPSRCMMVM